MTLKNTLYQLDQLDQLIQLDPIFVEIFAEIFDLYQYINFEFRL